MEECGIDHYLSGPWSSELCPNPKELRAKLGIRSDQIIKLATALSTEKLRTKVLDKNELKCSNTSPPIVQSLTATTTLSVESNLLSESESLLVNT